MTLSSFPDVNVWMAILIGDHVHRSAAKTWWEGDQSALIGFTRLTQISVLRLLTTSAVMNGKPFTMPQAWAAYDRLFEDERVEFVNEPPGVEKAFRSHASVEQASTKLWADAWLLALVEKKNATLVTFDRALTAKSRHCLLLA